VSRLRKLSVSDVSAGLTHGIHTDDKCQSAGCSRFEVNGCLTHSLRPKHENDDLAIVAL
jgi:hypothetical protein